MCHTVNASKEGGMNISAGVCFINGGQAGMGGMSLDISGVQKLESKEMLLCFCFSPVWIFSK